MLSLGAVAACGGGGAASPTANTHTITIALNIPVSADAYVAGAVQRGADTAVKEANAKGLTIGGTGYTLALKVYDDNAQPATSAQNVSSAISDGAVAVIEDGFGAATSAPKGNAAGVPEIDVANGTAALMDPAGRPSLFRLGIANDAAANRLGAYIAQSIKTVAIIHDDSDSGRDGASQLSMALATAGSTAGPTIEVPTDAATFDAQLQAVAAAHPGGLAIWGSDLFVAKVVSSAHTANLGLPLFAAPTAESPAVRATAGNAATDGLRFVSSRLTSEADATSFGQLEHRLGRAHPVRAVRAPPGPAGGRSHRCGVQGRGGSRDPPAERLRLLLLRRGQSCRGRAQEAEQRCARPGADRGHRQRVGAQCQRRHPGVQPAES